MHTAPLAVNRRDDLNNPLSRQFRPANGVRVRHRGFPIAFYLDGQRYISAMQQ
jgi:hypothetical protein